MICKKCGKEVNGNLTFCSNCGKRLRMNGCIIALLIAFGLWLFGGIIVAVVIPMVLENNFEETKAETHKDEVKEKFSTECQLQVSNAKVYDNIIGYPELKATFTNLSDKNIVAIELYFVPKDVYGEERTNWMSQNRLISDDMLYAGEKNSGYWSFIDKSVKNGDLYLYSVYYEDGTSWGDREATKYAILKYGKKIEVSFEK